MKNTHVFVLHVSGNMFSIFFHIEICIAEAKGQNQTLTNTTWCSTGSSGCYSKDVRNQCTCQETWASSPSKYLICSTNSWEKCALFFFSVVMLDACFDDKKLLKCINTKYTLINDASAAKKHRSCNCINSLQEKDA